MPTIEVTDATFERDVLQAELPVLVDFWAPWCGPCKAVGPVLEELSDEYAGQLVIAKVNVDACPNVAGMMRIQSIPTMVLFDHGRPVKATQGALPKPELVKLIEENAPGLKAPTIEPQALKAAMEAGHELYLVDIREPQHFSRSHLRKSRCVPQAELDAAIKDLDDGAPIVLISRTGERATEEAKRLAPRLPQVVALKEGVLGWEGNLWPTYSDKEEARLDG